MTAGVVIPDPTAIGPRSVVLDDDGHPVGAVCPGRREGTWTVTVYRRVLTEATEAEAWRMARVLLDHRHAGCWVGINLGAECCCPEVRA